MLLHCSGSLAVICLCESNTRPDLCGRNDREGSKSTFHSLRTKHGPRGRVLPRHLRLERSTAQPRLVDAPVSVVILFMAELMAAAVSIEESCSIRTLHVIGGD